MNIHRPPRDRIDGGALRKIFVELALRQCFWVASSPIHGSCFEYVKLCRRSSGQWSAKCRPCHVQAVLMLMCLIRSAQQNAPEDRPGPDYGSMTRLGARRESTRRLGRHRRVNVASAPSTTIILSCLYTCRPQSGGRHASPRLWLRAMHTRPPGLVSLLRNVPSQTEWGNV